MWKWWREMVLAAKKELGLQVTGTAEIVDRTPYPDPAWTHYDLVMIAVELG